MADITNKYAINVLEYAIEHLKNESEELKKKNQIIKELTTYSDKIEERKVSDFIKLDDIVSQCPVCKVKFSVASNENREIKYCPFCGVKKALEQE